jgi:hypothetical protein
MQEERNVLPGLTLLIGLGALEVLLLRIAGPPPGHFGVLVDLVNPMTEPLEGMLAALALATEALAGYLLLALALRTLTHLPGFAGQVANRAERMLTIPAVRRGFDALLGGALIAHLALAPTSAGSETDTVPALPPTVATVAASIEHNRWMDPVGPAVPEGKATKATASRVALPPIPLPIWLGGNLTLQSTPSTARPPDLTARQGSGAPEGQHTIEPGDTLWSIAAGYLPAGARVAGNIASYWRRIYAVNRDAIGSDPDHIHPGVTLSVPPYRTPTAPPLSSGSAHPTAPVWPRPGGSAEDPSDALP